VTGCGLAPNTDPCEDGKECTTGDTCADGACVSGTVSCDDGNLCTADSCGADGKCVHGGVDVTDGDLCTVDSCDPIAGAQHEPKSCPADPGLDACHVMGCNSTNGQCDPIAGNDGSSCTDVTGCSENATCQSGVCKGTPVILWSANFEGCDAGPMHSGAFEPYTFAIADPVAGQCSYGWLCNGSCPATPGGPTPGQVGYFDVQAPAGGATVYFQWTARTNGYGAWKLTLGLATDEGGFTELSPSASANQWTTASTTFEKGNTHRVILRVISDGSFSGDGSSTPGDGIFVDNLYLVPKNCPAPTP
ncbi:MAG: uncharacterized protein HW383_853, partial [Candidatus Magasanikbacteria bacterium]|nr:uncharacterized protein [Candidatus Magasanikbacteria bacterium]